MRRVGQLIAADILGEAFAVVWCGRGIEPRISWQIYGVGSGHIRLLCDGIVPQCISIHASNCDFTYDQLFIDHISWKNAVRSGSDKRLDHHPARMPGGAVHEIYSGLTIVKRCILVAAVETEFQSGQWGPRCFDFCTTHGGIEIQIDGCAVNDLRNLIVTVLVEKYVAIQRHVAIE